MDVIKNKLNVRKRIDKKVYIISKNKNVAKFIDELKRK